MTQEPLPEMRIGDAERETGLRALGDHMAAGRLDVDEYGDRSAKVAIAMTRGDLLALFTDLPDPRPRFGVAPSVPAPPPPTPYAPRRATAWRLSSVLIPIAAVIGIVLFFRFGLFPLLFLPLIIMAISNRGRRHHRPYAAYRHNYRDYGRNYRDYGRNYRRDYGRDCR